MNQHLNHQPTGRIIGSTYCVRCGLIYVNNAVTQRAIREGCDPKSVARRRELSRQRTSR